MLFSSGGTFPRDALVETFYGKNSVDGSDGTATGWIPYRRRREASMFSFLALGGGSGGGGGGSGVTGTARTGGSSGSTGTMSELVIPAFFLPREFYLYPGFGGAGDFNQTGGFDGMSSVICDAANTMHIPASTILTSGTNPAAGNGGALGGNVGTTVQVFGRSAEPQATNALSVYTALGIWKAAHAGITGSSGGTTASAGVNSSAWGSAGLTLGEGGGGGSLSSASATFAGGNSVGGGKVPTRNGGAAGGATGGNGPHGWLDPNFPWIGKGGAGGGSGTSQGGRGGDGSWGCGGGGGGGSNGVAGQGGNGGPGLIVVVSW